MPDFHATTTPPLPLHHGAPAPAGRGETPSPAASENPTGPSRDAADRPVDLPVAREAVRHAVTLAVTQEAGARRRDARRLGTADGSDALDTQSPELLRLLEHLRSTVTAYVLARRTEGVPIERVVPEMKGLVREAELCEAWRDPSDLLLSQVVRWGIEAYYEEPSLQHVPRFY